MIFVLGLLAALFKKPWSALLFLCFAIVGGNLVMQASQRTNEMALEADEIYESVCGGADLKGEIS